ncbi:MAG: hypothetical protein ABI443_06430 [Chthoniobacterales bacterium]
MSYQYEVIEENGEIFDRLTDLSNSLRIQVRRKGAELFSISKSDASGKRQGFLHRDGDLIPPVKGWANHATVMGYYTHRLWDGHSNYRGHNIHAENHGFLRSFAFAAPDRKLAEEGKLTYLVPADHIPKEAYPYKVSLRLTYSLSQEAVDVEFLFENEESDIETHLSFGLHPGFAVSSLKNFQLLMPKGDYLVLEAPGNFLNGKAVPLAHQGGDMPFPRKDLEGSFLVDIQKIKSRTFVLTDPVLGHQIELDYEEVPYITIWSERDDFLCVEPCWGLPDSNPQRSFDQKEGIQKIPPKGILKKNFRIKPTFLVN